MNNSDLYFCGDDLLGRGTYAQNIKHIVSRCHLYPRSNDNESYVIGIDAPWGTGKTHFVKMLKSFLCGQWVKPGLSDGELQIAQKNTGVVAPKENDVFSVVYYDAWENDFWNNAFEPLFDNMIQSSLLVREAEKKDIADLGKSAAKIIALGIKGVISKKIEDVFDTSVIDDINKEAKKIYDNAMNVDYQVSEIFPDYELFRNAIESLRNYLKNAVKQEEKLVIIIDELDRCKPTFAVQTLEIVKHLFNVSGIVFLFSLDIRQLSQCVKTVYGADFEAVGYLERFFNYLSILPRGNTIQFHRIFFEKCGIGHIESELQEKILKIFEVYNLSLREAKTVMCAYYVLQETSLNQYADLDEATILYLYFLCMKYKHPLMFYDCVFRSDNELMEKFLLNHPIPFISITSSKSKTIIPLICTTQCIGELSFEVIKAKRTVYDVDKSIRRILDDIVAFDDGSSVRIDKGLTLSYLLYTPDLKKYEEIYHLRMIEYIYRQLELCDFSQTSD